MSMESAVSDVSGQVLYYEGLNQPPRESIIDCMKSWGAANSSQLTRFLAENEKRTAIKTILLPSSSSLAHLSS